MALKVGTVTAEVTADTGSFTRSMRDVRRSGERAANSVRDSFQRLGPRFTNIGQNLTAGLTLPLVGIAGAALKTAADFESLKVQLEVLTGSGEEAAAMFEQLAKFAAETPFELNDVAKAGKILLTTTGSVEKTLEVVRDLGDIAAVSGSNLSDLTYIMSQIQTKGQAMTEELRQFGERGIPIFRILADSLGVSKQQVTELVAAGKIGFQDVANAINDATSEQGQFFQGAEKASRTLAGTFSTMMDSIKMSLADLGNAIAESIDIRAVMRGISSAIDDVITAFNGLSSSGQQSLLLIAGLLAASGPVLIGLGALSAALAAISWPAVAAGAIIAGLGAIAFEVANTRGKINSMNDALMDLNDVSLDRLVAEIENASSVIVTRLSRFGTAGQAITGLQRLLDWAGIMDFKGLEEVTADQQRLIREASQRISEQAANLSSAQQEIISSSLSAGTLQGIETARRYLELFSEEVAEVGKDTANTLTGGETQQGVSFSISGIEGVTEQIDTVRVSSVNLNAELTRTQGKLQKVAEGATITQAAFAGLGQISAATANLINSTMSNALANMVTNFATAIGKMAVGAKSLKGVALGLLSVLADMAIRIGTLFVTLGTSVAAALNPATLFASLGTSAIVAGGALIAAGAALKAIVGGLGKFHTGGIVGGSGEQMIMAKGGEGVFTSGQMKAMGLMINRPGGGSQSNMQRAFEGALRNVVTEVSPSRVFELSQKGRTAY